MFGFLGRWFGRPPRPPVRTAGTTTLSSPTAGDLRAWCRANWDRVPEGQRKLCLEHLRTYVTDEYLDKWRAQRARGEEIGSDVTAFHFFGGGMQIRNVLREVLPDDQLPAVVGPDGNYPPGEVVRNWDDFYTGALEELVETTA